MRLRGEEGDGGCAEGVEVDVSAFLNDGEVEKGIVIFC